VIEIQRFAHEVAKVKIESQKKLKEAFDKCFEEIISPQNGIFSSETADLLTDVIAEIISDYTEIGEESEMLKEEFDKGRSSLEKLQSELEATLSELTELFEFDETQRANEIFQEDFSHLPEIEAGMSEASSKAHEQYTEIFEKSKIKLQKVLEILSHIMIAI